VHMIARILKMYSWMYIRGDIHSFTTIHFQVFEHVNLACHVFLHDISHRIGAQGKIFASYCSLKNTR